MVSSTPDEWECGDCGATVVGDWCQACLTNTPGDTQVGGSHYVDKAIQPWDIIDTYGLSFYEGNVLKYLLRYKDKNGVEDLKKARHYLDKLIEVTLDEGEVPTNGNA